MTRHDALAALHTHADAVRAMGATALYLFGSTAADQATATSDLDIYIDYDPAASATSWPRIPRSAGPFIWGVVVDELPRLKEALVAIRAKISS